MMQLGLFNIFWMSNIYMQGQMAEINEPVKIIIYLTLVSVDASVMFAIALLSREVVVGRSVLMCFLSKAFFAVSLGIFYDDRVRFIFMSFLISTIFSQAPLALTIARVLSDTEEIDQSAGWIDMYVILFLDLKFIVKACLGLSTKVEPRPKLN